MPVFTGAALALGALATAGTAAAASASAAVTAAAAGIGIGGAAAAGGTAAAAGAAGAGIGASLGVGGIGAGAAAGLTAGTAGATAATAGAAAAGTGLSLGTTAATLGGVGTAASLGAQGLQMYQQSAAADEQRKQEGLRQQQMTLEADRQRRDVIRQTQIAQAIGINNAAGSGAAIDSSVLSGIVGQNTTNQNYSLNSINQNEAIGSQLFASNSRESQYNSNASLFGGGAKIGQQIAGNNMQGARLATTLFNG